MWILVLISRQKDISYTRADLCSVAEILGLEVAEIIKRHTSVAQVEYHIAMLGI